MPNRSFSYTKYRDTELKCALEIKRYISDKNYRLLKAFLQKFSKVNLPFLYHLNWKFSLLAFAINRLNVSPYDEEQERIIFLLIAYGFSDQGSVDPYYSSNQKLLHAIADQLQSFRDVKGLNHYYHTFVTEKFPTLSDFDRSEIELRYTNTKMYLKRVQSRSYWPEVDKFLENPSNTDSKERLLPYLSECSCHFFDRKLNSRRKNLVHKILQETKERLPRDSRLVYLSFGCGDGLQDFELIYHFITHAYTSIKVILIDIDLRLNMMRQMKELCFVAAGRNIKFEMLFYDSIDAYRMSEEFERPNLVCAIDFNNIFAFSGLTDLMKTHSLMASDGYYYLSFTEYDIFLDFRRCRGYEIHAHQEVMHAAKKQFSTCPSFETLCYASLGQKHNLQEWLELSRLFNQPTCREVSVTLIKQRRLSTRGYTTKEIHEEFTAETLGYFFRLLFSEAAGTPKIVLFDTIADFIHDFNENPKPYDVVTLIDVDAGKNHASILQRWFFSISANTHYFYRLFVETKQGTRVCEQANQALQGVCSLPQLS